jgi:hypothetical protein
MRPKPGGDPWAMMAGEIPDDEPGKCAEADEALGESQFSERRFER